MKRRRSSQPGLIYADSRRRRFFRFLERRTLPISRTVRFLLLVILLYGSSAVVQADWHAGAAVDTDMSGRQVSEWEMRTITKKIPAFEAIYTRDLLPPQVSQMGRVFAVRPAAIEKFLWGPSMAPPSHRLAGTRWYTIWYTEAEIRRSVTLRMDTERRIIERVRRQQSPARDRTLALED